VLLARVVGLGCGTASQMLLARLFEPEQLAAYFLTLSVVEVAAQLTNLGLPRPLTRFVAQACSGGRLGEARGVLEAALPLWLGCSAAVVLLYASGFGQWLARSVFRSEIMASGTVIAALWIAFQGSAVVLAGAVRGFRRVGLAAWVEGAIGRVALALVLLGVFLVHGSADFLPVLMVVAASAALGPMAALVALRAETADVPSERASKQLLVRSGLPLLVTGLVSMSYVRSDLWTVGFLFEPSQVALYGAAKRLVILVQLPMAVLSMVVPPIVAELHARQDMERLQQALRGAATLSGLPAIAALILVCAGSEFVLGLVYGEFFRAGGVILTLLCIERMVFVWVGPAAMTLAMTGHERTLMRITLATSVLTVASVVLGAHLYGFNGVAGGYVVGSTGQQIATWLSVRRLTGLRTDMDPMHLRPALEALRRATRR
jgi:O-antigen/teichoic acid export membrane protein